VDRVLHQSSLAKGTVRSALVVPLNLVPNERPRLLKYLEDVLPNTLLLETSKEPLNDPVLFRRIRRDEFLLEPIMSTRSAKTPTLEKETVVTPKDRRLYRSQRPEPRKVYSY
jgi:hypothetical protein